MVHRWISANYTVVRECTIAPQKDTKYKAWENTAPFSNQKCTLLSTAQIQKQKKNILNDSQAAINALKSAEIPNWLGNA